MSQSIAIAKDEKSITFEGEESQDNKKKKKSFINKRSEKKLNINKSNDSRNIYEKMIHTLKTNPEELMVQFRYETRQLRMRSQ